MITKVVAGAAIFVGLSVLGAAPAGADPNQSHPTPSPNPFAGLTCNCHQAAPTGGPNVPELERGLQAAISHG
jgi:hypothetical protein